MLENHKIQKLSTNTSKRIKFKYKNYRNEISWRTIEPIEIRFGSTEWHNEPQWLLRAFDIEKDAEREFAIKDILIWSAE